MADVEPAAQIEEPKEVPKDEVENENPAPEESVPEKVDEDNKDANMESEKKKKKKKKSKKKTVGRNAMEAQPRRIDSPRSAQPRRIRGLVREVRTDHRSADACAFSLSRLTVAGHHLWRHLPFGTHRLLRGNG